MKLEFLVIIMMRHLRYLALFVMLELATEEYIAEKVFKYLITFDCNCIKSKTYPEF